MAAPIQDTHDLQRRIGRKLGDKWLLEDIIGTGATAAVYRARGPSGTLAAVKVMSAHLARDETARRRFFREHSLGQTIQSPGIVKVFELGSTKSGTPFMVMELLEGENFEERAARKGYTLPIFEVLWLADRVLDVLIAAHDKGIVHRDIKPENLFLCRDHTLRVLDFGVAKTRDEEDTGTLTNAGALVGTLAFMPPEQARGETTGVGIHSDLWALGATMFTLLTGRLVHEGEDIAELFHSATGKAPPSLGAVMTDAPRALVELVDFALAPTAEGRWSDARVMQRAVREVAIVIEEKRSMPINVASPADFTEPVSERHVDLSSELRPVQPPPVSSRRPERVAPPARQPDAPDAAAPTSTLVSEGKVRAQRHASDPSPPTERLNRRPARPVRVARDVSSWRWKVRPFLEYTALGVVVVVVGIAAYFLGRSL